MDGKNKEDKENTSELEEIIVKNIAKSEEKENIKKYISHFDVILGIVKQTSEKYEITEIKEYPSIDVVVEKAVSYSIRSGKYENLFRDYMNIKASDGKDVEIKGKYGDIINLFERVYVALMIIFKPDCIIKSRGLIEKDAEYKEAIKSLESYNSILKQLKSIEPNKKIEDSEVEYCTVKGKDLLEKL
jgi:hypothetical protein